MAASPDIQGGAARRRPLRRIARSVLAVAFVLIVAFGAGFAWFVWKLPATEVSLDRNADGIVVMTGGASRISDAIELLSNGHGKRLLISGVHRDTSAAEIARINPRYQGLVACCVDLDHSAINTVGNATETRRWAHDRGFSSLIVVTSAYHMPRTMAELATQMPGVALVPFPVVTEKLRNEPWWASAPTARLVLSEYAKFVVAQLRMRIEPAPALSESTGGRDDAKS
jgi:uncharacterized SAM-binding protein YcdF (DUF218 family)